MSTTESMAADQYGGARASMAKRALSGFTVPVTVVLALFVLKLATPINYDPDLYWHLKTGEYIVANGALPHADVFSHTMLGADWVLHEWLSEVIFYAAYATAGFTGLNVLVAALYALTFCALYRVCGRTAGSEMQALIVALLFFAPLIGFTSPRPQLFTYLFFVLYVGVLVDYKYRATVRLGWVLPLVMIGWANLHGASIVGVALLALFVASEWVGIWLGGPVDPARRALLKRLTFWSALGAAATLCNPRFVEYWIYPFYVLNLDVAKGVINEWQSPNFHSLYYRYFLGAFLLFFAVQIYSRRKPELPELVLPLFFIVCGFTAVRHLPLACLAVAPFFALFVPHLPAMPRVAAILKKDTRRGRQLDPAIVNALNFALLICVGASIVYIQTRRYTPETIVDTALPVKAASFVAEKGIKGRMFNEYGEGGYLIYRLYPEQRVFVDGRADLYGNAFLNDYFEIVNGRAGWKKKLDAHRIDYAILPKEVALRQLLLADGGYKLVYDDERHSVIVRNSPQYARLAAVSEWSEVSAGTDAADADKPMTAVRSDNAAWRR
ncbi:MAG: hypothetical protein ACM3SS_01730 [Rhodospirillaceae bacterium]